jgi:diguanylate cyclase (GGDEF)-like protein
LAGEQTAVKLTDKNPTIALTAVLICIIAGLGINSINQQTSQQSADRQVEVFKRLADAKTDLRRAVVSHAAYMLTGSNAQLAIFADNYNKFKTLFAQLREDPELSRRFDPLRNAADSAIDDLKLSASVRRRQGLDAATRNMIASDRTSEQIEEIDRALSDAEEYELGLVSLQVNGWKNAMSSVQWMIITVLLLCGFAYLSISRSFEPALKAEQEKNDHLANELDAAKKQLDRLANVDFLTEVLNMRGLEQVLAIEENRAGRAGGQCVAVLVNCDNFRKINETRGHAIGDAVLKEVAKRISGVLRPADRVARVGSDEFIIILIDTQLAYAMRVAERIRTTISESAFKPGGDLLNITASLGVATLPLKFGTTEDVITLTRSALKRSKSSGRNRVSIARDGGAGDEDVMSPRDIVEVLCDGAHFRTVFQPIVALGNEEISGYEIFTRGPDGAFESPAEFFRVCVENNILTAVDILCLKLAISTVADTSNVRFHINMFPSTLLDTQIENIIALFPPDKAGKFCIELSEEQFVGDPGYLREHVYALRQAGIMVAIDDIGFGRSSLESLILLEPDIVKIDRKYVTGVSKEPGKQRLLKRVVNVGKSLGAEVVAEGIENAEDLPILREIGIQYGQGYYWGELMEVLPTNLEARQAVKAEKR